MQAALRSQGKSRLVGANCPGMIVPGKRFKMGIQPLAVHSPGIVGEPSSFIPGGCRNLGEICDQYSRAGLASRSGTISYELASLTTELGLGQSVVFGLGGDPFPGTRTWEALEWMLQDPATKRKFLPLGIVAKTQSFVWLEK